MPAEGPRRAARRVQPSRPRRRVRPLGLGACRPPSWVRPRRARRRSGVRRLPAPPVGRARGGAPRSPRPRAPASRRGRAGGGGTTETLPRASATPPVAVVARRDRAQPIVGTSPSASIVAWPAHQAISVSFVDLGDADLARPCAPRASMRPRVRRGCAGRRLGRRRPSSSTRVPGSATRRARTGRRCRPPGDSARRQRRERDLRDDRASGRQRHVERLRPGLHPRAIDTPRDERVRSGRRAGASALRRRSPAAGGGAGWWRPAIDGGIHRRRWRLRRARETAPSRRARSRLPLPSAAPRCAAAASAWRGRRPLAASP